MKKWGERGMFEQGACWHEFYRELDPGRRRHLLKRFEGVQTIVTCTDMSDLAEAEIGAAYRIDNGTIEPGLRR